MRENEKPDWINWPRQSLAHYAKTIRFMKVLERCSLQYQLTIWTRDCWKSLQFSRRRLQNLTRSYTIRRWHSRTAINTLRGSCKDRNEEAMVLHRMLMLVEPMESWTHCEDAWWVLTVNAMWQHMPQVDTSTNGTAPLNQITGRESMRRDTAYLVESGGGYKDAGISARSLIKSHDTATNASWRTAQKQWTQRT